MARAKSSTIKSVPNYESHFCETCEAQRFFTHVTSRFAGRCTVCGTELSMAAIDRYREKMAAKGKP